MSEKKVERHSYKKENGEWVIRKTFSIEFEPYEYNDGNVKTVVDLIKSNLDVSLLEKKYRNESRTNRYYGHCYHSTQAIYYMFNTDRLKPYSAKDDRGDTHWWLQDGDTIIDATAEQYTFRGVKPPYDKGKESKWYGWKNRPHKKSLILIKRVTKGYHNAII